MSLTNAVSEISFWSTFLSTKTNIWSTTTDALDLTKAMDGFVEIRDWRKSNFSV